MLADFFIPVADDGGGTDQEKRIGSLLQLTKPDHQRHGLVGFPQAHIVAKQPAETVFK